MSMVNFTPQSKYNQQLQISCSCNTLELFQQPIPAKLWIVQFSSSLYLYILFAWQFKGHGGGGLL